jgi:hypothetical protein
MAFSIGVSFRAPEQGSRRPRRRPEVPVNTIQPTITGSGLRGTTHIINIETWTGEPYPKFSFEWFRNNVRVATTQAYSPFVADIGVNSLMGSVIAYNAAGTTRANTTFITISDVLATTPNVEITSDESDGTPEGTFTFYDVLPNDVGRIQFSNNQFDTIQYQATDILTGNNDNAAAFSIGGNLPDGTWMMRIRQERAGGLILSNWSDNVEFVIITAPLTTSNNTLALGNTSYTLELEGGIGNLAIEG